MDKNMERRSVTLKELRIDTGQLEDPKEPKIVGYASVFDSWSEELGGAFPFREKVLPGAFVESIVHDDIRALFNHDPNFVLGRNKSGTLELAEDQKGLLVKITPPDTQWARDLLVSIKRGDVSQMSFGFIVKDDAWGTEDGMDVRELKKVSLFDVSPVTFPAYTQTDVGIRSADDLYQEHLREAERSRKKSRMEMQKRKLQLL